MSHRNLFFGLMIVVLSGVAVWIVSFTTSTYSLAHIEEARTPQAREQGLSGRDTLPEDYGMLFIFPDTGDYGFWMKDMKVPIDIFWLGDTGTIVAIEKEVSPDTYPYVFHSPLPVRYVLETKAGMADMRGWKEGMTLKLPLR